jgi:hypothetical protein
VQSCEPKLTPAKFKHAPRLRRHLLRLQTELDQKIAEAEGLVENANMPVPEWVQANVMLKDLEQTRAKIEGKLRRECRTIPGRIEQAGKA